MEVSSHHDDSEAPSGYDSRSQSESISGTQLEAGDIDSDLAIENIPDLDRKSMNALHFLLSTSDTQQLLSEVRIPGSKIGKRFENHFSDFLVTKTLYGSAEFLNFKVLWTVFSTFELFTPIFIKANCAALALGLVNLRGANSSEALEYLSNLEMTFPTAFYPPSWLANPNVRSSVQDILLEIRTQVFIASILQMTDYEQPVSFDEILMHAFFEQKTYQGDHPDRDKHLGAWLGDYRAKDWDIMDGTAIARYSNRVNKLRESYMEGEVGNQVEKKIDVGIIASTWHWETFVDQMVAFIRVRVREIDADNDIPRLVEAAKRASLAGTGERGHAVREYYDGEELLDSREEPDQSGLTSQEARDPTPVELPVSRKEGRKLKHAYV